MTRWRCWPAGTGWRRRHRSLAATAQWSYQLLAEAEQRVFRAVSVFPAPFTLEAAEAVAGQEAVPAVLRLVDCSLLVPPRAGPDGRLRYGMLETLRGYGAGLLAEAGEDAGAAAALAGYAVRVAEQAAAGLMTGTGEVAAARWLDAEDATMRQVLARALAHDPAVALRLAIALGWWWFLRGRLSGQYLLLGQAAGGAEPGSDEWCAAQDLAGQGLAVLGRYTEGAGPPHRGPRRHAGPEPVPPACRRPGLPGYDIAEHGPDRRGGRGGPPRAGHGPGPRLPGRRGGGPGNAGLGRLRPRRL